MDLYALLGLSPAASAADIKRAYRRLARRYHPDINPGDEPRRRSIERISEAYETLVDPDRRRGLRLGGRSGAGAAATRRSSSRGSISRPARTGRRRRRSPSSSPRCCIRRRRPTPGGRSRAPTSTPRSRSRSRTRCAASSGRSSSRGRTSATRAAAPARCARRKARCAPCHGSGKVRWARGHMVFTKSCAACDGSGRQRIAAVRRVRRPRPARAQRSGRRCAIPAGVHDGARLRVAGSRPRRPARRRATAISTSTVHVQPHPVFRRAGGRPLRRRCRSACTRRCSARASRCPSLEGPGEAADSARHAGGPALPAARPRRADGRPAAAAISSSRSGSSLPQVVDERGKELMREFGKLYGG